MNLSLMELEKRLEDALERARLVKAEKRAFLSRCKNLPLEEQFETMKEIHDRFEDIQYEIDEIRESPEMVKASEIAKAMKILGLA